MNKTLTSAIVKHLLLNLKVFSSDFINNKKTLSIKNNKFLLKEKLIFGSDNDYIENDIWGCELFVNDLSLKILLGDCSQDTTEYAILVKLENNPIYACYFNEENENDCMIAFSVNEQNWIICNTYLQATFLAGMEQSKDFLLSNKPISKYNKEYDLLLSFIKYHHNYNKDLYER